MITLNYQKRHRQKNKTFTYVERNGEDNRKFSCVKIFWIRPKALQWMVGQLIYWNLKKNSDINSAWIYLFYTYFKANIRFFILLFHFPNSHNFQLFLLDICREMVVANKGNSHVCRFSPDLIFFHFVGTRPGILS